MESISRRDLRTAIEKSGYILELRLVPQLQRAGFHVFSDKQFQDQDTGKSREIDLYGWRSISVKEHEKKVGKLTFVTADCLEVKVVIECKANTTPLVFFTSRNHHSYRHVTFGGYPRMAWRWDKDNDPPEIYGIALDDLLGFKKFHSNWKSVPGASRFAKLVSRKHSNTVEWELDHGGIYPSVDKLCRAANSAYLETKLTAIHPHKDEADQFHFCMTYPVLVLSGELFECRVAGRSYSVKPTNHLFLDWHLEGQNIKGPFRIAVVREPYIEVYLKQLSADIAGVTAALHRRDKSLREAMRIEFEHHDKFTDTDRPEDEG